MAGTQYSEGMHQMSDRVVWTVEDGVADVRLNRPEKMNALDQAMFTAIADAGEQLKRDPKVRAVVLSGEGRAFCAGLDFGSFRQRIDAKHTRVADTEQAPNTYVVKPGRNISGDGDRERIGHRIAVRVELLHSGDPGMSEDHSVKLIQICASTHRQVYRGALLSSRWEHRRDASLRKLCESLLACDGHNSGEKKSNPSHGAGSREM